MCINTKIDNTVNRLANVFISKNIPVMPISEYTYFDVDCEDSGLYILELIDELESLLGKYWIKNDTHHRKFKYYKLFKELYLENVEEGYLLPRPVVKYV